MELERPLASLWSLIRDHSKTHLYNTSLKSAWTRLLDDATQLGDCLFILFATLYKMMLYIYSEECKIITAHFVTFTSLPAD